MKYVHFALVALVTTGCVSQERVSSRSCAAHKRYAAAYAQPAVETAGEESGVNPMYFGGTWEGQGCQSDGPCWTVKLALEGDENGDPTGVIAYPSDRCAAQLEFVQWEAGDVAAFRERFENPGKCVPNGWLRLRLIDKKTMNFVWAHPDGRVDAGTTLYRSE